jgi:hypothetical protein
LSRSRAILVLASTALLIPAHVYSQGYGGPSLLSRGGNQPGKRGRFPIDFNFYAAARGTRDTGLIAPLVDDAGNITPVNSYGAQLEIGAYGAKTWRRSSLGLDYRGDYRRYTQASRFNGMNQALSLDYTFQPTRRMLYFTRLAAGTSNRAFGGFAAPTFADQQNFGIPLNEVYDSRSNFGQLSGGVSYQKSARSTYTVLGEGFVIKRQSRSLIGVQGYRVSGAYQYRLTRSDTVGVAYNFIRFTFPRVYGESQANVLELSYNRRLTQNWDIRLNVGAYRVNTEGVQRVQLSPEVAAILGRSQGVEAFRRVMIQPQVNLGATYTLERSRFMATYQSGVGPGNGVYITSRQDGFRAGYSYSGIRKLSLGASAGYTRFNSLGLQLGSYRTIQGGGGMNYRLAEHLNFSAQIDRRKFDTPSAVIRGRSGTSMTIGLSYSPARFPLSIW